MENVKQTVVEAIFYFEEMIKEADEMLEECPEPLKEEMEHHRAYCEVAHLALNLVHQIHMKQEQDRRERE